MQDLSVAAAMRFLTEQLQAGKLLQLAWEKLHMITR
jgi:hypothetical protein